MVRNILLTEDLKDAEPVAVFTRILELMRLAHDGCYNSEYNEFIKPRLEDMQTYMGEKLTLFLETQTEIHGG